MPHPPGRAVASSLLGADDVTHRHRLNSRCLRELTYGRFIIKFEDITLLKNIGQGAIIILEELAIEHLFSMHHYLLTEEFGVVYRGRLGSKGFMSRGGYQNTERFVFLL